MKIAKYVGDLLYNYECVVIPGLGGFLTNDKPATINTASNLFKPPFKQISFNAFLKTNDGLLVNYVAREESLEYKAAKEQVDRFVLMCDNALKEGKRINFHRIGYLYLNENQQISFEQDSSVNYNADAFGLTSFISPAVYKQTPEEKLREKVVVPQPSSEKDIPSLHERKEKEKEPVVGQKNKRVKTNLVASKRKSPYRTQMAFLVVIILAMFVGWGFMNKTTVQKYYSNYSSIIPLFYSSPNTYLVDNMNHGPMAKISDSKTGLWIVSLFEKKDNNSGNKPETKVKNSVSQSVNKPNNNITEQKKLDTKLADNKMVANPSEVSKKSVNQSGKAANNTDAAEKQTATNPVSSSNNKKQTSHLSSGNGNGHIYIIAGAFRNKANAEKLIHKLRLKGYPAVEAGFTRSGLLRVAFGQFNDRNRAERQLIAIRSDENSSAWIFEN